MIKVMHNDKEVFASQDMRDIKSYLWYVLAKDFNSSPDYLDRISPSEAVQELLLCNPHYRVPYIEFWAWLDSQKVLELYMDEFITQNPQFTDVTQYFEIAELDPEDYLGSVFNWSSTEDEEFWVKLDLQWQERNNVQ